MATIEFGIVVTVFGRWYKIYLNKTKNCWKYYVKYQ
jgi:hypothetical protein